MMHRRGKSSNYFVTAPSSRRRPCHCCEPVLPIPSRSCSRRSTTGYLVGACVATSVISVHHHARSKCRVTVYLRERSPGRFMCFPSLQPLGNGGRRRQSLFGCQSRTLALRRALSLPRGARASGSCAWLPQRRVLKFQFNLKKQKLQERISLEFALASSDE